MAYVIYLSRIHFCDGIPHYALYRLVEPHAFLPGKRTSAYGPRSYGLGVSSYVVFHLAIPGLLSWVGGQRFLLPSLGPSIFALATLPNHEMHLPRRVIGGQTIGAISAFLAAHLIFGSIGFDPTLHPFSPVILRQVAATFVAVL